MRTELEQALTDLARVRAHRATLVHLHDAAQAEIERTPAYIAWVEVNHDLGLSDSSLAICEARVRDLTLAQFKSTGDKAPALGVTLGVSIKMFATFSYDLPRIRTWALQHMHGLLTIDRDALKLAAKAGLVEEGVTRTEEPKTQIASDLGVYLKDADTEGKE